MKLRAWQASCIRKAIRQFNAGKRHFLCLATPGAGKTHMASTLAARLLSSGQIDFVICFAPSVIVAKDFQATLEQRTGKKFDGLIGARGATLTYQAMLTQPDKFWALFREHRVLSIFDEIHHCAGQGLGNANAWGERIITQIQEQAAFTLALTGTPWRSDQRPIVLASYGSSGVTCDFTYGIERAITEGVCRIPQLTLIDNDHITVQRKENAEAFGSVGDLLSSKACSYEDILRSDEIICYSLSQATACLNRVRLKHPEAGGLIVAASVEHAHQIARILQTKLSEAASIATYRERDPTGIIEKFKHGSEKWIISVGMISEGTNVPRLRVCCHLTRIKTELHFRQVLGRILRADGTRGDKAYFYMPAEPTLAEYANRLATDVPDIRILATDIEPESLRIDKNGNTTKTDSDTAPLFTNESDHEYCITMDAGADKDSPCNPTKSEASLLSTTYEYQLVWSERFRKRTLSALG